MIKVLFVCLGNICRSPLAEAIFNHQIQEEGLEGKFKCDSCGTSDFHIGELPDERSIKCAEKHGMSMTHRGRQITHIDIREYDYIIAMDKSNKRNIEALILDYRLNHDQIFLMRDFQLDADHPEVPDPYYGGEEGFEEVYKILQDSISNLLIQLKKEHHQHVQS